MDGKPKKAPRAKDLTARYMDGSLDEDRIDPIQRFSSRSKHRQHDKTLRTALMREEEAASINPESLPIGQVIQVYSLFCQVESGDRTWLCVLRKTLAKVIGGDIVVGDIVRFRDVGATDESGQPEGVIEQIDPRKTVLTRTDSFKQTQAHPIVANADQMLIVASVREPDVKWGLVDRMIAAAQGGGLTPIICLNKIDFAATASGQLEGSEVSAELDHYASLGIQTLRTSVVQNIGISRLEDVLRNRTTVLAGHSGVGKSSLIRAIQSDLELRIGQISGYTGKGRHTTTSARRYALRIGGQVIDTPGVKLFGLWGVTRRNLTDFFPDVTDGTAPAWRKESYRRIQASLAD